MVSSKTFRAVASNWRPVSPRGSQGDYIRPTHSSQSSAKLRWHQNCVAQEMEGVSGSRGDIRERFADAAENCRQRNPH